MPKFDCLVVGEANVDLMIDSVVPLEFGKEKLATRMDLVLGGSSSITAYNLASMGAKVDFCGIVGTDLFGRFVRDFLRSGNVGTSRLIHNSGEKTGVTIWHSLKQRRAALTYPGTIPLLCAQQVENLHHARHLHVGSYFLLTSFQPGAAELFRKAKNLGLTTSLDCNFDPSERWDGQIREVLPYVDFFLPNDLEAKQLTGEATAIRAARSLAQFGNTVVVKQGARGAIVCYGKKTIRVPALKVRVVDTTGAGDSFNAGFLSAHLRGKGVTESVQTGIQAAARSVQHIGGTAAFAKL